MINIINSIIYSTYQYRYIRDSNHILLRIILRHFRNINYRSVGEVGHGAVVVKCYIIVFKKFSKNELHIYSLYIVIYVYLCIYFLCIICIKDFKLLISLISLLTFYLYFKEPPKTLTCNSNRSIFLNESTNCVKRFQIYIIHIILFCLFVELF
jgi:hypothetical protein